MSVHAGIKPHTGQAPESQQDTDGQASDQVAAKAVRWEVPPPIERHGALWALRVAPLIAHPMRWARLGEFRTPSSAAASAAKQRKTFGQTYEFTARKVDGVACVFGRYLGPEAGK